MEYVISNASGRARRVTENGRDYLVVSAVMIVPGVLNGSRGSLYYSPRETARATPDWDGMPVTARHPFDPMTNEPMLATQPGVLARQGIGFLRNTKFDGRLCTNVWLDVEKCNRVDPRIVAAVENGRGIELSTGLRTKNVKAEPGAVDQRGRQFDYYANDHRPDHLAVLMDERGACSLLDGCGLNRNSEDPDMTVETATGLWAKLGQVLFNGKGEVGPKRDAAGEFTDGGEGTTKEELEDDGPVDALGVPVKGDAKKTDNANPEGVNQYGSGGGGGKTPADKPDVLKGLNGRTPTTHESSEIAHQASAKAGHPNLASATHASKESAAGNHAEAAKHHSEAERDHTALMGRTSGKVADAHGLAAGYHQTAAESHRVASHTKNSQLEEEVMNEAFVDEQIANASLAPASKSAYGDSKKAFGKSKTTSGDPLSHHEAADAHSAAAKSHVEAYRTATGSLAQAHQDQAMKHQSVASSHQQMAGQLANNQGEQPVTTATGTRAQDIEFLATNCDCWKGDRDTLNKLTDAKLVQLRHATENAAGMQVIVAEIQKNKPVWQLAVNAMPPALKKALKKKAGGGDEEDDEEDDEDVGNRRTGGQLSVNQWEQQTFANAPAAVRNTWETAKKVAAGYKQGLIEQLISHISEPAQRQLAFNYYNAKDPVDLQTELAIRPQRPTQNAGMGQYGAMFGGMVNQQQQQAAPQFNPAFLQQPFQQAPPNFAGAGNPAFNAGGQGGQGLEPDVLEMPTMNYASDVDYLQTHPLHHANRNRQASQQA